MMNIEKLCDDLDLAAANNRADEILKSIGAFGPSRASGKHDATQEGWQSWVSKKIACTECGKPRSTGSHAKCSRARQMRFAAENK